MQRLDLVMDDPTYELELKQTLTIKPDEFYIHAIPRKDKSRLLSVPASALAPAVAAAGKGQNANGRGTSSAAAADGSTPWFKIFESGYDSATDTWGNDVINDGCGKQELTIPSDIADGDYLLRAETIAL